MDDYTFDYTAPIGEWVHLAFVSNDQGTTLYVNGVETDHIDATINGPVSRIGANYKDGLSDRGYMKGAVDDVQIYDRALSAEEIVDMKEDAFGFENEMIFNFDEGEGTQISDTSGAHSFTLGDGITWTDGKMGSGLDFSGAGRIELGYRDLDKNWSVGLWVNRRESVEHNAVLMSGATGEIKLDQYQNTGKVGVTAYGVEDATFDYSAPMDEWVHLTFVSNDQGTTLYVNGVEQDHIDLAINGPMNRIGGNNSVNLAGGGLLNATIDQLSVFDRSLTADEVKDLVDVDSEPANKTLLAKTIAYAKGLDTTGVTDSAKAAFEKALAEAEAVMADANATQTEVDAAWDNLLEGIWGLGLVQGDKTMLEQLINKADGMIPDEGKYMPDHWQELVDALAAAKDVMADGDAMEEDIQPVAEALLNAILAQRFKADKSILDDLINNAEGINMDGYTDESAATIGTAVATAQAARPD